MAIESTVAKAGGRAASYVGKVAWDRLRRKEMLDKVTARIDRATFEAFLASLTAEQGSDFLAVVESPEFDHLALRITAWTLAGRSDEGLADIRHSVRQSLRARLELADDQLLTGTDLMIHLLTVASESAIRAHRGIESAYAVSIAADLAAAAARRHELLEGLPSLRAIDHFSRLLRAQVGATRTKMRLAHLGRRAGVEYGDLHVDPTFHLGTDHRSTADALQQFQRIVVLGDPGAGKSTFAAKLAHDLARDAVAGFAGRVPFLVFAREHAEALRTSRRPLVALLEDVAKDPYNLFPPADAIEYLLLNGSAFVIIDGVDELGGAEDRRRLAELVEAFAHHYPLVNIVVTSRKVGYDEAALDDRLFEAVRIAPFSDAQIAVYARRWFALERGEGALAKSFLGESANIPDLRSNPLMLSLLCSLYESKHYLPTNRAQIYENCAELLFERWDQGRGMSVPMRFGTHMRPAVARLAWLMFTDPSATQVFSRERVAELLIEYMLEQRFDDWTDAATAAAEFLDYCAGRAWLLTEIGVQNGQAVYGFTHRTFLEYFAAVHLVRLGPSPEQVWERLRDRIPEASWRTVAHLSVHRLERDCQSGSSGFLELLLDQAAESPHRRDHLLLFGVEVAAQLGLRSDTLRRLARECVRLAGEVPSRSRAGHTWAGRDVEAIERSDRSLAALIDVDLPENATRLATAVVDALCDSPAAGSSYGLLGGLLATATRTGGGSAGETLVGHPGLLSFAPARFWVDRLTGPSAEDVAQHGGGILFQEAAFLSHRTVSGALRLLTATLTSAAEDQDAPGILASIYRPLADDPWPWIRARDDAAEEWALGLEGMWLIPRLDIERFAKLDPAPRSTALLLLLVMLEHAKVGTSDGSCAPFMALHTARKTGWGRASALGLVGSWGLLPEAEGLAVTWINAQASPVEFYR